MEDNSKFIQEAEDAYITESVKQGRMSTEVLNVCVITEAVRHCLANIVAAMERPDHVVAEITPQVIQGLYEEKKAVILKKVQEMKRTQIVTLDILNDNKRN